MKVFLKTLGCRLNESELERMGRTFRRFGHEIVKNADHAEMCVINTCAVTNDAGRKSRQLIYQAHRDAPEAEIVVTGCYSQIEKEKVESMPGVAQVVDNIQKDTLVQRILGVEEKEFDAEPMVRQSTPGELGKTRAFLKVQDGCKNRCTFCVTTIARGDSRSRSLESIVREVHAAENAGYQEIVLSGVHLGSWGREWDAEKASDVGVLIQHLLDNTSIPRIRLSSLEPWDIPDDFFKLWANPRMCRHFHIPLQAGCDRTLRRMARRTRVDLFRGLVEEARGLIPDLAISTDMIVGFPGETDEDFAESLDFAREMDFCHMHIFRYSPRPGTAAATMPNQIPGTLKAERSKAMHEVAAVSRQAFLNKALGQETSVLWEQKVEENEEGILWQGLTDNYRKVRTRVPRPLHNQITDVRLVELLDGDCLLGRLL
jgi:threonylcarbamoyladenosine tRNA methylthiotransferase MtaB